MYLGMRIKDTMLWNETYTEVVQTVPAGVFADKNVRLAASYAIDQQLLAQSVFCGVETPAETLFDPSKPYCNVSVTTYETDAAKASALLEEAGWTDADGDGVREKDGEKLHVTISFTNDFGTLAAAMSGVKAQLEAVGFSVELAPAADMMGWFMAAMTGSVFPQGASHVSEKRYSTNPATHSTAATASMRIPDASARAKKKSAMRMAAIGANTLPMT